MRYFAFVRYALLVLGLVAVGGVGCSINPIPTPGADSGQTWQPGFDVVWIPDLGTGVDVYEFENDVTSYFDVSVVGDTTGEDMIEPFDVPQDLPELMDGVDVPELLDGEAVPDCVSLDNETLEALVISLEDSIDVWPGDTRQFGVGTVECCVWMQPVENVCVVWSVWPERAGASIDPETGELSIHENTPHGTVFTVSADIEEGRRVISLEVHVFTPEGNPLVGHWRETGQIDCDSGELVSVEESSRIGELRFKAGGDYFVTWRPFEVYVDYWGRYEFDRETGALRLGEPEGNYVPETLDLSGRFFVTEEGDLQLRDLWLGSPQLDPPLPQTCGHFFQ